MIASTITITCAIIGLILARNARKPLTKSVTIFLAIASLIYLDPIIGVGKFGIYVFAFASVMASVEPSNSLNLKPYHKTFFIVTAIVIVLMTTAEVLKIDSLIPKYIFGMLYCITFGTLYFKNPKKLKSRVGILIVWLAEAIKWSATILAEF